jgi:hypothetical protein
MYLGSSVPDGLAVPRFGQAYLYSGNRAPVIKADGERAVLERRHRERVLTLHSRNDRCSTCASCFAVLFVSIRGALPLRLGRILFPMRLAKHR